MVRDLLIRGMIAGAIAGLLVFSFAKTFGEPQVDQAIAFEDAHKPAGEHEVVLVSREVQSTIGLATAVIVYGAAMGGLFSLAFSFLYGRIGDFSPRVLALLLALAAFAAIYYVPSLKYPANPPSVGEPATIAYRTGTYLLMVLVSLAGMVAGVWTVRRLAEAQGVFNACIAGLAVFIVIASIGAFILPVINEVPKDFSANVLWKFRMASLGMQTIMWGSVALIFGWLAERRLQAMEPQGRLAARGV